MLPTPGPAGHGERRALSKWETGPTPPPPTAPTAPSATGDFIPSVGLFPHDRGRSVHPSRSPGRELPGTARRRQGALRSCRQAGGPGSAVWHAKAPRLPGGSGGLSAPASSAVPATPRPGCCGPGAGRRTHSSGSPRAQTASTIRRWRFRRRPDVRFRRRVTLSVREASPRSCGAGARAALRCC